MPTTESAGKPLKTLRDKILAIPTANQNPSWVKHQALHIVDTYEDGIFHSWELAIGVLRFHDKTPEGDTVPCLPDCVACEAIKIYDDRGD